MSKKWKIAFSLACAAIATVAFGACGGEVTDDDSGKYEYCYRQEFTDKHDDDMKIDGVLDEARWQDSLGAKLYHGDDGITAEYTTAFSEYGVYVAATVYDPAIIWRGRYDLDQYVGSNSGFTFYIHLKDVDSTQSNKLMKFETDAFGQRSYSQQHFEANTTVSGEVNGKTESMTTEMFVSWRALGLSELEKIDADDIPEYVAIEPLYRHITLSGGNYIRSMVYPTFTEPDFLSHYPKFGKSGYLAADKDDSAIESGKRLGAAMAGHRLAKTGNWNMDNYLDEGLVISGGKGLSEVLFFKDVYAENFYAETYIDVSATNGKVGLTAQTSFNKFRAVYLNAGSLKGDSPAYNVNSLTYHPDRKYHETYGTRDKYTAYDSTEPVHFEMIKRGDSIFAFVNGTLMYADSQSWYGGEYAPGLYATEADAAFVNSYATALTATEADEKLAERNASRVTLDYNRRSGGTVTTDKLALDTKDNLSLGVEAPVGYVVSSFSINGEDKTEEYVVSARDGKYVPSYLADADGTNPLISKTGNTVAAVEFTAVTDIEGNPAKGKTYSLGVKADGAAVSGAKVTLTNVDYPSVAYTVTTSSSGEANFADIAAKDFAIFVKEDETKFVISGAYDVTVTANGYLPITKRITADENFGENGILSEIVSLARAAIGGSTALGSKVYESDLSGWTIGGSAETGTTAHLSENSGSKRVMFGDKKSTAAVIDFTYINNAPSTEDGSTYRYYDQYIGIGAALVNDSLGDGFGMVVVGGQVRTFSNLDWSDSTSEAHSVGYSYLFNTSLASLRGKEVKMRYVHVGKSFAAYVYDSEAGVWRFLYAERNNAFANESAYAMYSTSLGRVDVDLKDVSIIVGAEAESFIAENHPYALAAPIGTHLDKVTIEKTSGEEYGIGAELEYTVTADDGYYIRNITLENPSFTASHNADGTVWTVKFTADGVGKTALDIGAAADGIVGGFATIGETTYASYSGYDYSDYETDGTINVVDGTSYKHIYFNGVCEDTAVIDFTINNVSSDYLCVGALARTKNGSYGIGFAGGNVMDMPEGAWNNNQKSYNGSHLMWNNGQVKNVDAAFRYVKTGSKLLAFIKVGSAWSLASVVDDAVLGGKAIYSLYNAAGFGYVIKNVSIKTGAEAETEIAAAHSYTITASGNEYVNSTYAWGESKVLVGETVSMTLTADDGYYIRNVTAENATLTASHNADGTEWNITLVVGGTGNVVVNIGAAADGIVGGFATIGETTYASDNECYDYSNYDTSGEISVIKSKAPYPNVYFNGVCADTAVVDFSVNTGDSECVGLGLLARTTSGSYGIGFVWDVAMDMPAGAWNNDGIHRGYAGSDAMWKGNAPVKNVDVAFRYVKTGSKLLAFIKVGSSWSLASVVDDSVLSGNAIYSIYNFTNPNYVIKNVSIKTGAEAETEIAAAHSYTITTNCDSHINASSSWGSGKVLIGDTVSITLTPDSGYAIKNIISSLKTSPSVEIVDGTVQKITLTASSDVTFTVTETSADKYLQPIRLSKFPEGYESPNVSEYKGIVVRKKSDAVWGHVNVRIKPEKTDLTQYDYLEYVINTPTEWGGTTFFMLDVRSDNQDEIYRIGKRTDGLVITRTLPDGTVYEIKDGFSSSGENGMRLSVGEHESPNVKLATYRIALDTTYVKNDGFWENAAADTDVSYADMKDKLKNISALAFNFRTDSDPNMDIHNIYGVKSDGTRELLFDASKAEYLGEQADDSCLTKPNQVYTKMVIGGSGYGADVSYRSADSYVDITEEFRWMSMNDKNTEIVSLVGYDALTFDIDTTAMTADNLPITVRIGNESYGKKARAVYAYIVDSTGNATKIGNGSSGRLDVPKGTKGKFVVLLRDFTASESGGGNMTNLVSAVDNGVFRFVVGNGTANYLSGQQFDIRNVCFVTDGQTLVG